MKTLVALSLAALLGVGTLASSAAEARGGGALAAGLIGGLAAGALLGAAASQAHAAPAYGYGYGGPAYGYETAPPVVYRPTGYGRSYGYEVDAPISRPRRFDAYDGGPVGYGYRRHGWHRDCDRPYGDGGW